MSFWAAATQAWRLGRDTTSAVEAGHAALAAGQGPFRALHAFAAETQGKLDDQAVEVLEAGLRKGLEGLAAVITVAAWAAEHEGQVKSGVTKVTDTIVDLGYRAGWLKSLIRGWLDE